MHYANPKHERLYRNVTSGRGYQSRTLAALFLLTAHHKLWKNWCKAVDSKGIEASLRSGVLTVFFPCPAPKAPRRIPVTVN